MRTEEGIVVADAVGKAGGSSQETVLHTGAVEISAVGADECVVIATRVTEAGRAAEETVFVRRIYLSGKTAKERITGSGDYISSRIIAHERVGRPRCVPHARSRANEYTSIGCIYRPRVDTNKSGPGTKVVSPRILTDGYIVTGGAGKI